MANSQYPGGGGYGTGPSFGRNAYDPQPSSKPAFSMQQSRLHPDRQQPQQQHPHSHSHPQQLQQQQQQQLSSQPLSARADPKLGPVPATSAYSELNDDQKEEINEAFQLFDLNKDGYVDYHELRVAFKALGFNVEKPRLVEILTRDGIAASSLTNPPNKPPSATTAEPTFSGPNRYLLSKPVFQNIVATMIAERPPEVEVERAFQLFVQPGQDKIGIEDLQRVANELGENLSPEELMAMIDEFDMDGDGLITKEDFISICMG